MNQHLNASELRWAVKYRAGFERERERETTRWWGRWACPERFFFFFFFRSWWANSSLLARSLSLSLSFITYKTALVVVRLTSLDWPEHVPCARKEKERERESSSAWVLMCVQTDGHVGNWVEEKRFIKTSPVQWYKRQRNELKSGWTWQRSGRQMKGTVMIDVESSFFPSTTS